MEECLSRTESQALAFETGSKRSLAREALNAHGGCYELAMQQLLCMSDGSPTDVVDPFAGLIRAGSLLQSALDEDDARGGLPTTAQSRRGFKPRSSPDFQIIPNDEDLDLVEEYTKGLMAQAHSESGQDETASMAIGQVLGGIQPYTATTLLGERSREWAINLWAIPGNLAATKSGKVALCMHGHGSCCGVGVWGKFFAPLHNAGFHTLALYYHIWTHNPRFYSVRFPHPCPLLPYMDT
jgi:hypothetical protein